MFVRTNQHFEVSRYARHESIHIRDNKQNQHNHSSNKEVILLYE